MRITMSVRLALTLLAQVVGILLIGGVAIAAWGLLGFLGWLGVLLYLAGEAFAPPPPLEENPAQLRGQ